MLNLLDLFRRKGAGEGDSLDLLHKKYEAFKRILESNNRALEIIADLEHVIYQDRPFHFGHVLMQSEFLIGEVFSIVEDLNALSGIRYPELFNVTEDISSAIFQEFKRKKRIEQTGLVIPFELLSLENAPDVGGKAANLGEVYNRVHLPVPPGFAVTAYACQQFLDYNDLTRTIEEKLRNLDVNDTEKLMAVSGEIQSGILKAELPADVENSIIEAARTLKKKYGDGIRLSVRSSATSEDSEASFAGQHSTVLNVGEEDLIRSYREVVSSTFNPRAIFYRRRKGFRDQDVIMSVACVAMIDPVTSGVMYTVDPNDGRHAVLMISALWGLAVGVVDGSTSADFYQIDKKTGEIEISEIATKGTQLRPDTAGGLREEAVEGPLRAVPCLDRSRLGMLVECGLRLEEHYGYALDVEWAIDRNGRLYVLQARPLKRSHRFGEEETSRDIREDPDRTFPGHPVLLRGGASASDGTAAGPAYIIKSEHNFHHIPEGAVIVARQTSPRYVPLMGRITAIVTDVGSVTGHMASVAREFRIPTLVGTGSATATISHGEEVTVDATNRTVYRGRVAALLRKERFVNPMKGSPVYRTVLAAIKRIAPLTLTDPKEPNFTPEACRTIHDVIRFSHEMAMQEMFRISDDVGSDGSAAVPLKVHLPLKIYLIDLGRGLSRDPGAGEAAQEDVRSVPFRALLKGMTHRDVSWTRDVGVSWRGFGSIVAESVFRDPMKEGGMGGPNYAIVGEYYLNFSSRLGYHFATVDTYCGPTVNDNYVAFYFKGGAADIGRRSRRALLIAIILRELGFKVDHKSDMVRGELKKYLSKVLEEKLDMLGRVLGSVRLLDMVLSDDGQVEWYADQFLKGNYAFDPSRP